MPVPALPPCAETISAHYNVPVELIHAVRVHEGGKVNQSVCKNRDGSCDNGPMQINDGWFDGSFGIDLRKFGITKQRALSSECQNIAIGAWVLRMNHDRVGNWREAVAAYNTGMKNRNGTVGKKYSAIVFRWWDRLKGGSSESEVTETLDPIVVTAQNGV